MDSTLESTEPLPPVISPVGLTIVVSSPASGAVALPHSAATSHFLQYDQ